MKNITKKILVYSLSALIPYWITKKYFPEKAAPELNGENGKDVRGGDGGSTGGVLALVLKDRAVKIAITTLFSTVIVNEFTDQIVLTLIESSPALLAAPGNKAARFSNKIQKILQTSNTREIKEILLDKHLSNKDKLELLRIKIQSILKGLKGSRRKYFILSVLSLLIFIQGNNTPVFAFFWANLRELFGETGLEEDVTEHVIDLYREYNAPMPEELINMIEDKLY